MLSKERKQQLRHVTIALLAVSFVLLYLGAVTLVSAPLTVAALAVTCVFALLAVLTF